MIPLPSNLVQAILAIHLAMEMERAVRGFRGVPAQAFLDQALFLFSLQQR